MKARLDIWAAAGALVAMIGVGGVAYAEEATSTFRDWRVENPMTAGITKGLTLGMFPGGKYAQGAVRASEYDPFGMSPTVYQQVAGHGRNSHQVGQVLGYGFWMFTLGGVFYRLLHKLKVDALEKSHAS